MKKYFYFLCITILPLCGVWACSNENTESHDEFGNQGENIPTAIKKLDYGQLLAFPGAEGHGREHSLTTCCRTVRPPWYIIRSRWML